MANYEILYTVFAYIYSFYFFLEVHDFIRFYFFLFKLAFSLSQLFFFEKCYWLIDFREREKKHINLFFYLFMPSLVDSHMWTDSGLILQPSCIGRTLQPSELPKQELHKILKETPDPWKFRTKDVKSKTVRPLKCPKFVPNNKETEEECFTFKWWNII